jgi:hypothetical protein
VASADPFIGNLHNVEITRSGDINGREISGDNARLLNSLLSEPSSTFLRDRRLAGLDIWVTSLLGEQRQMIENGAG